MVAPSVTVVVRLHPMGVCSPNILPCSLLCLRVGIVACTRDSMEMAVYTESATGWRGNEMRTSAVVQRLVVD